MEKRGNGAFRQKKVYFTQVSNNALRDNELSLKSKGLYALIQSYITREDFTLYKSYLKKQCKEGEKAFENTWKELKESGYLIQHRFQDSQTKHFFYEYELLDEKDISLAEEIHGSQNRKKQGEKSHNPQKGDMAKKQKAIPTKREGMANLPNGKVGVYNNTNINNTNISNTNTSSSSIQSSSLAENFTEDICDLRKTTASQFLEYTNTYTADFIKAIIEYCSETGIKSFAGFKTVIDSYIEKNILTREALLKDIEKFRKEKTRKKFKRTIINNNKKVDSFNNYKQRDYDFEKLEKLIHGDTTITLQDCMKEEDWLIDNPVLQDLKNLGLA